MPIVKDDELNNVFTAVTNFADTQEALSTIDGNIDILRRRGSGQESNISMRAIAKDVKQDELTSIDDTDSPYTIPDDETELLKCDTTNAAIEVLLPATGSGLVNIGHIFTIFNFTGTNNLTLNPNGNQINGSTSNVSLNNAWNFIKIQYLGNDQYLQLALVNV